MKIVISPDEMVAFVTSGNFPESAKKTLAGGVMAMCNSPEMLEAIMTKVNSQVEKVMAGAISMTYDNHYNGNNPKTLKGWAADILLNELTNKAKQLDMKDIIRTAVAEEVSKQFESALRENIKATIASEYKEALLYRVERYDIAPIVEAKVKAALANILAK